MRTISHALAFLVCAAPLMSQGLFGAQQIITTNATFAESVYAADIDGDGDLDVLSASFIDDKIAWYENTDGLGTFGAQQIISTNVDGASSVYAADIDSDGDIDVLSASYSDNKIAWYENTDGLGTFSAEQVISTSANGARGVYAADVDGDGDVDVLSASYLDDKIAWYENTDGLGAFGAQQVISTNADGAINVYAADVDGDGDVDVLAASYFDDKITWYANVGGGIFGAQQIISTNADGARSVFAADVDGDGDVDALSASIFDDKIAWYENTDGLGSFGPERLISINADGVRSVYATDVDGDGDVDALSASVFDDKIAWYENIDGCGTFSAEQIISTNADAAFHVYAADVDGDGDIDVLSASAGDNKISWYKNLRAPTPAVLGDGCGATAGNFCSRSPISTNANGAFDVYAADVDGDGDIDVLSAYYTDSKIVWYENTDGLGTFGLERIISTSLIGARAVHAADVDGDGDLDVLSASRFDNKIAWYENINGQGTFGAQQIITTSADQAFSVYAADVDGDGDVDVLSASQNGDTIAWHENINGQGTFGAQQIITTSADSARSVYAADLDGDGDFDVLSASRNDNKIAWYRNLGGGTFGPQQIISTNAGGAFSVYVADLDGDGDGDVLSASRFDDKIAWYKNTDGLGNFGAEQIISTFADDARTVYAADLDSDGDLDVLSASAADNKIAWYENTDGQGTFGSQERIGQIAVFANSVYAADFDGDGDVDVISASVTDNKIAWYENFEDGALTLSSTLLQLGGTWTLHADNVVGPFAVFLFGDTAWNIPLDLLGGPGCTSYTNANLGTFVRLATNGTSSMPLAVPSNPALVGFQLTAQSTCASSNALGFSTSNGLLATVEG